MPEQLLKFIVPAELHGMRLDRALAQLCPQHSRTRLQSWIRSGRIKLNNRVPTQREKVTGGEQIEIRPPNAPRAIPHRRQAIALDIVHEDNDLLVINKPPGLVVHPGAGNPSNTLLNALLHYDPRLDNMPRAGIVQRLDKDTSGLMLIAKTPSSHTSLVRQLAERRVHKEYEAIVCGVLTAGGTVDRPIGRHPTKRTHMAVIKHGKSAITHYRVIRRFPAHTHITVVIETGRTHQIRVHMQHIGHPLLRDPVYGGRTKFPRQSSKRLREAISSFPRQGLHAKMLRLRHPRTQNQLECVVELPPDMVEMIALLSDPANYE